MQSLDYFKHLLVRTPLEPVARGLRQLALWPKRCRHPELAAVLREDERMDAAVARILTSDACCCDIGAHLGGTLSTLVRLAPRGRHAAFEPVPHKAAWLRRKFPEVQVFATALGERSGEVTFYENCSKSGYSSLAPSRDATDRTVQYTVPLCRFDAFRDQLPPLRLIKIDVEGAEVGVLRGGRRLLERDRPHIIFESGPGMAERCGYTRGQLFGFLTELGYALYVFDSFLERRAPLTGEAFEGCHRFPFRAFNYVAAPAEHAM